MSLLVIVGYFDIHPEDAPAAAELMRTMMSETRKEPGCRHYAFSADLLTPHRFQLSELWEDEESLAAHFRASHMTAFRAGLAKLRIEKRIVTRYEASNPTVL